MARTSSIILVSIFFSACAVRIEHTSTGDQPQTIASGSNLRAIKAHVERPIEGVVSSESGSPRSRSVPRGLKIQRLAGQLQDGSRAVLLSDPSVDSAVAETLDSLALQSGRLSGDAPSCKNCQGFLDYQQMWQRSLCPRISLVALCLWACVLIWLLATTAQDFFVPPLLYWSERLHLQPEVAGATLLALGNGAPDIFAVCTAASREDLPLALSEMIGSNMFTLCITGSAVLLTCYLNYVKSWAGVKSVGTLSGSMIHRTFSISDHFGPSVGFLPTLDLGRLRLIIAFYLVTLAAILLILIDGYLTFAKAMCLPLLYVCFLIALFATCESKTTGKESEAIDEVRVDLSHRYSTLHTANSVPCFSALDSDRRQGLRGKPDQDYPLLQFMLRMVAFPFDLARWATIPPSDCRWDNSRRVVSAICPFGLLIFCMLISDAEFSLGSLMVVACIAVTASLTIYFSSGDGPALPWFYPILTLTAQIASIIWLAAIAGELTAIIETAGFAMEIPRIRLGFTAISWGDALGDTLTCIAMVRSGQARAAMTAVFANSVLDDLLGFGLALVFMSLDERGTAGLWDQTSSRQFRSLLLWSFGFLIAAVFVLSSMLRHKGCWPQLWSGCLFLLYISFLATILKYDS